MKTPYYVFDADSFKKNYIRLLETFRTVYPDYQIAYSFKTNYTPAVCRIVLEMGGYAEVVSDMEYELAKRIGFSVNRIIYNGPSKQSCFEECIMDGGLLNIDNFTELDRACSLAKSSNDISVGLRVNFDVGNGLTSRFGIDTESGDFDRALSILGQNSIKLRGLHFHISRARSLEAWEKRIEKMLALADRAESTLGYPPEYIDIGSGMFGDLSEELKRQFDNVPSYEQYACTVAGAMAEHYRSYVKKPLLFTEPGTTLVSRYFSLYTKVVDIKHIREKSFALLDCSFHNVGEICGLKNVPVKVVSASSDTEKCTSADLVGYTCLEQDVICRNFAVEIGAGDLLCIENVGGYSIVDKPPFIHPDIPIYMNDGGKMKLIKREQTLDDIFAPYYFED